MVPKFLVVVPALVSSAPDYFHFIKEGSEANFDSQESVADGVSLFKWSGTAAGIEDMQKDVCAHNVLQWDAGSVTPYPPAESWHSYDTVYFVNQGNVTITVEGETKTMKTGDTLWVQAGVSHSSLVPVDNRAGVIVNALKTPFEPQLTSPPATGKGQHRFYMASEDLTPPDVHRMHDINQHDEWMGKAADPDVLHVWWRPNGRMPCHSHGEGALYVTAWGMMCFNGETKDCRIAGEARWTKPHYEYANEQAGPEGSEIVVMNIHTGPRMCHAVTTV